MRSSYLSINKDKKNPFGLNSIFSDTTLLQYATRFQPEINRPSVFLVLESFKECTFLDVVLRTTEI